MWGVAQASLLLFAKPSVCVYQKDETIVGSQQVLSQFVYKKRETVVGPHQLPPKSKAAVHVNQHSPSDSRQTLRCRQRRLERVSRFLSFRMDCALAPLREVVPMDFFFADDVEVLRLTAHCVSKAKCFLDAAIPIPVVTAKTKSS